MVGFYEPGAPNWLLALPEIKDKLAARLYLQIGRGPPILAAFRGAAIPNFTRRASAAQPRNQFSSQAAQPVRVARSEAWRQVVVQHSAAKVTSVSSASLTLRGVRWGVNEFMNT